MKAGRTIWITGLSGAGKSTLAGPVADGLRQAGEHVVLLDGDELRAVFGPSATAAASHTRDARLDLALRYGRLCRMLSSQGLTVVIATISLYREVQDWNRKHLPGYTEVFLDVPLEELRRRDPKGIYRRFDAGEITDVSGLDVAVDFPAAPDLHLRWEPGVGIDELTARVLSLLRK